MTAITAEDCMRLRSAELALVDVYLDLNLTPAGCPRAIFDRARVLLEDVRECRKQAELRVRHAKRKAARR